MHAKLPVTRVSSEWHGISFVEKIPHSANALAIPAAAGGSKGSWFPRRGFQRLQGLYMAAHPLGHRPFAVAALKQ